MSRFSLRVTSIAAAVAALWMLGSTWVTAATRYDPRLRFRTLSTARFDIHFHQGVERAARRLAQFAEDAAADVDRAVGAAVGRVQVIIVDQHDLSNGWATPLPYNTIEISVAAPSAESSIGNTDDWLRLVFVHEYTHIAHLSRAEGWIRGLRRGFGRLPVLFPNLYQPIWAIEGIATWRESVSTGQGRVPAGDFRQLIERQVTSNRFEPIDRTNGGNVDWPGGATPYVYGAYFHEYLSNRYGSESIRTVADETSRRVPYLASRAYKRVFGRSLGQLWEDFAAATRSDVKAASPEAGDAVRLTTHGFIVSGPRFGPGGDVYYSTASPHHFPALMKIEAGGTPRRVARRYLGNSIGIAGDRLVLDEIDLVRSVAQRSDLYVVNPRDGSRHRLTHDARAGDPDVSRSGVVVCTIQLSDRRAVATFALSPHDRRGGRPEILIGEPATDFAMPRWSPDSRFIAVERRIRGGGSEIVLVDTSDRSVRVLASMLGGRSAAPTWTPDGTRVIFSAAVEAEPFRIYAAEISTGAVFRLEGTGASAQSPDVSSDGQTLIFVGYTVDGYDLFSLPLARARWTRVHSDRASTQSLSRAAAVPEESSPPPPNYSPRRTLTPQFWTPTLESDAGEVVFGAATGSLDVLGRHAYGIEAGWSGRARPDWQAGYVYDRWRPTVFFSVADDTDPWREGTIRTRESDVGMLFRYSKVRSSHTTVASYHVAIDSLDCEVCAPIVDVDRTVASLRVGWSFSSAKTFGYSISAEDGQRVSVTAESTRTTFGADGNGFAMTVDARQYTRAVGRHGVLAVRAAAAGSWGDRDVERRFSASGSGPQLSTLGFGTDAIGLLRGFDKDALVGTRVAIVNADLRIPLRRIDRGAGTIPVFIRSLHGSLFMDAGHAWVNHPQWSDVRMSIGGELSVDSVVGFALPVTFTAGAAWTMKGASGERRVAAFGRVGRAF